MANFVICSQCRHQQKAGGSFCSKCGNRLPGLGTGSLSANYILQGRYLIDRKVGQGGMGAVYRAVDQRLGNSVVAIKELTDAALTNPQERVQATAAFEQEARLLARLQHPNIPSVTNFFTENHKHYIVMEFVHGETLEKRLDQQPVPCNESQVRSWALELCGVLEYLHAQHPPIIFRDLKPGNIMLTPEDHIKLIDFGIVRLFKPGQTTDTTVLGTPGYAPPEQYGKGQTDARSDVYSLGVVLHHLLTLHDPAQTQFSLPPVRQLNSSVTTELEAIISKATQPKMQDRFQTIREFRHALENKQPPTKRDIPLWLTVLFAGALLGIGAVVVSVIGNGSQATPFPTAPPSSVAIPSATSKPIVAPPDPIATPETPTRKPTETRTKPPKTPTSPPDTPTPRPTRKPTSTKHPPSPTPDYSVYKSAISNTVSSYGDIKEEALKYLDPEPYERILIDPVLERHKRLICDYTNKKVYYTYENRQFDIIDIAFDGDRYATVLARIQEDRFYRKSDGTVIKEDLDDKYEAIYQLKRIGANEWFIYCFQALSEDDPQECNVILLTPNPCDN